MLRTGSSCQALLLLLLLLWVGFGDAQTLTTSLLSAPTTAVSATTAPISGVLTNTITSLASSSSPPPPSPPPSLTSVANFTSSFTTSPTPSISILSGIDDPTTHLHSIAPVIAGSLAAFMVLLAAVLVIFVASKRKGRRSHTLSARFTPNAYDRSTPSRRSSMRHHAMRQPMDSPTASIDLGSRPSKKHRGFARFDDDIEAARRHEAPPFKVPEDHHRTHSRHTHQHSSSSISATSTPSLTTSSPITLSSNHSADVKHLNILDQTPALQSSVNTTNSRSRSASPSQISIPLTQPANGTTHSSHPTSLPDPPEPLSTSVPTLRRDNLIALLQQQQQILLLSGSRDSRTVGAVALLQEQIDMLRQHQRQEEVILGMRVSEAPPAYEDSMRS